MEAAGGLILTNLPHSGDPTRFANGEGLFMPESMPSFEQLQAAAPMTEQYGGAVGDGAMQMQDDLAYTPDSPESPYSESPQSPELQPAEFSSTPEQQFTAAQLELFGGVAAESIPNFNYDASAANTGVQMFSTAPLAADTSSSAGRSAATTRGKGTKRGRSAEASEDSGDSQPQPPQRSGRTSWIPVTSASSSASASSAGKKASGRGSKPSAKAGGKRGGAKAELMIDEGQDEDEIDDEKITKRERNKVSACKYRKRRKIYLDSLEAKAANLAQTVEEQNKTITTITTENNMLKEQLEFFKGLMASSKMEIHSQPQHFASSQQPAYAHSPLPHQQQHAYSSSSSAARPFAGAFFALFACFLLCAPLLLFSSSGHSSLSFASSPAAASFAAPSRKLLADNTTAMAIAADSLHARLQSGRFTATVFNLLTSPAEPNPNATFVFAASAAAAAAAALRAGHGQLNSGQALDVSFAHELRTAAEQQRAFVELSAIVQHVLAAQSAKVQLASAASAA